MAQKLTNDPITVIDENGNLNINISITSDEQKFMLNELSSIEEWVTNAIAGKLYKCKTRMIKEWNPKFIPEPINGSQWLDTITNRSDYDTRSEKDEKAKIKKDKKDKK